jgi:hypothetical protein
VNLGCDGYKLTCDYGEKQIHYVVAPILVDSPVEDDGMGVNGWIETTMDSFGDMSTFEPFMHDKVQLFVGDVVTKSKDLEAADHKVMRRSSIVKATNEQGKTVEYTIGHAMVAISGKIWDFVGVIDDPMVAVSEGFDNWSDDECPLAHEIRGQSIPELKSYVISESKYLLLSIQMATSSLQSQGVVTATGLLKQMTGANEMIEKGKYCDVQTIYYYNRWAEFEGSYVSQIYLKYVVNHEHQTSTKNGISVKDYEDYIYKVHEKYLSSHDGDISRRWLGWDHWLDQHIGIKYAGPSLIDQYERYWDSTRKLLSDADKSSESESTDETDWKSNLHSKCLAMAKEVNEALLDEHMLTGKRFILADGDHYYTGVQGSSMCIEFNTECHYGQDGATDICTCDTMNSDLWALEHYDPSDVQYLECMKIAEMDGASSGTIRDPDHAVTGADKPN